MDRWTPLVGLFCIFFAFPAAVSGSDTTGYQTPPASIAALIDTAATPRTYVSPDKKWVIYIDRPSVLTIEELAARELKLGGMRIDPDRYTGSRSRTYSNPRMMRINDGELLSVKGLPDAPLTPPSWSPDSSRFAIGVKMPNGLALYTVDTSSQKATELVGPTLNAVMSSGFTWLPDGSGILAFLRTKDAPNLPEDTRVPEGPNVQISSGKKAPVRTYQDLLTNPFQSAQLEHYLYSQLTEISLKGKQRPIGKAGMLADVTPSPDGKHLLVQTVAKPFSYLVPIWRFGRDIAVWDRQGKLVQEVATLALAENVPKGFDAVRLGKRNVFWRQDAPATLVWIEAADGGNPATKTDVRDKVFMQAVPFKGEPQLLASLGLRARGVQWSDGNFAMVSEGWWSTRKTRTWIIAPDTPTETPTLLFDRTTEDRYSDPGFPLTAWQDGKRLLQRLDDGRLLMLGQGASPDGDQPFLDAFDPVSKKAERLWQSKAPYYEEPRAVLNDTGTSVLITRETPEDPANFYHVNLSDNSEKALTAFSHPAPAFKGITKELITFEREDGVQLSGELYLPAGYDKDRDGRLPLLMWAYPREFKSAKAASQISGSPYEFTSVSYWGPIPYLAAGYAVLSRPTMPIIGEGDKEPNDTYVEQLVASAAAAIDAVVERGIADRERVAIGGHSYGAFMVANLLAHSDLFKAGIARSGAYNRSLTPFGFQAEQRSFWEAQHVYARMSPFFNAEKINEPMLMIHGEVDNNSGTYPLQSRRMFQALKGLGVPARLVMLPHESHGYRARESLLHMLWEQHQWLETHVKGAPAAASGSGAED